MDKQRLEKLTTDQQLIYNIVENTDCNILIHGKPGVGKTVLIRALDMLGEKDYSKAAPTGLAAINMGGGAKTLHSLFMIPVSGIVPPDYNKFTNNPNVINHVRYAVKHLIIDEISMVRSDILDYIDRFMRFVKEINEPFGGIQVICVGDFFQLPPVVNSADRKAMVGHGWKSEFAFDAKCFEGFQTVELNEVLRQKGDDKFINVLHSSRTGAIKPAQLAVLNKRVEKCTDFRIRLCGTNKQAEEVNIREMARIDSEPKEYHANSFGVWPAFPVEPVLTLKVGAQVLIKKNGADRVPMRAVREGGAVVSRVVNGTLGIIEEMPEQVPDSPQHIKVRLRDDSVVKIYVQRWEQKVKEKIGGEWTERLIASFEQMPLQLAWAISMHKSQGQSFEFVHVDPSAIFAAGQLYVALSRARSLAGLSLESRIKADSFWANKRVLAFSKRIAIESQSLKQLI